MATDADDEADAPLDCPWPAADVEVLLDAAGEVTLLLASKPAAPEFVPCTVLRCFLCLEKIIFRTLYYCNIFV